MICRHEYHTSLFQLVFAIFVYLLSRYLCLLILKVTSAYVHGIEFSVTIGEFLFGPFT